MNMDYSITRQLSSQIPDRVSTYEIKAGLQRIKKAQEQVLLELKRTHPDQSIDFTNHSRPLPQNFNENEGLKKQLTLEREKSIEKSTLYRRRVVDLEASLNIHEENQRKLRMENKNLEEQLRGLRSLQADLQRDYQKLVEQCQISNRNVRNLQKQVMQLVKKTQQNDSLKLRSQFQQINAQRNSIMSEKVALLKINSKLESENIELKTKLTEMVAQKTQSKQKNQLKNNQVQQQSEYKMSDLKAILNQIHKMNTAHESIFTSIKSNTKLSRALIEKENSYQNSLNKILGMFNTIQKGASVDSRIIQYKFDNQTDQEQYVREEVQRAEGELIKKHKKQLGKYASDKQELQSKIRVKDRRIQELEKECEQKEQKIIKLRKEKSSLMQQISEANIQIDRVKQNVEKQDSKRMEDELRKQKNKDEEYRVIIQQLNEQMVTIQKQKKDLDGLIGKMTNNKSEEELKNKKKLNQILDVNQKIRQENEKIKEKYEAIFLEKEHLYLSFNQCQNKNNNLNKELARQILQKQKLIAELNKLKQEYEIGLAEVHKLKLLSDNTKKQCENLNNSYLMQIERLIQESLLMRQQIQILMKDRNELRDLKGKYGLLMKDNKILGQKAKHVNNQIDHLWTIKEVQYQNINKIVSEMRPL